MKRDPVASPAGLERLIEALRVLPGVGPRSAASSAAAVAPRVSPVVTRTFTAPPKCAASAACSLPR